MSISPITATIVTSLLLLTAQPASANPNETPEAFLRRVYALYRTSDDKGVDMTRPAGSAFFAAPLLDALAKDQAMLPQDKEGVIDYDPVCVCQAWEKLRVEGIALSKGDAGTVKARVTIGNFVAPRATNVVVLTLSRTPVGWRIADIGDTHRASLMAALKDEINEMKREAKPAAVSQTPKQ